MRTETDRFPQDPPSPPALEETVQLLAEELRAVRKEADRQRRRWRLIAVALVTTAAPTGWSVQHLLPTAEFPDWRALCG